MVFGSIEVPKPRSEGGTVYPTFAAIVKAVPYGSTPPAILVGEWPSVFGPQPVDYIISVRFGYASGAEDIHVAFKQNEEWVKVATLPNVYSYFGVGQPEHIHVPKRTYVTFVNSSAATENYGNARFAPLS